MENGNNGWEERYGTWYENLELHCTKRYIVIFAFPRNGAWAFNAECQNSFYETRKF